MNFSLRCHLCNALLPAGASRVCDQCLGPLEVTYDYDAVAPRLSRTLHSGFTPLVWAARLGRLLGVRELYVKADPVNHPTFSCKDRVVSVHGYDEVPATPDGVTSGSRSM